MSTKKLNNVNCAYAGYQHAPVHTWNTIKHVNTVISGIPHLGINTSCQRILFCLHVRGPAIQQWLTLWSLWQSGNGRDKPLPQW